MLSEEDVWEMLSSIMDPEIPIVSIVEMGIVRSVKVAGHSVKVELTPTFSGCPALEVIQRQVEDILNKEGLLPEISWKYAPAWSSDWINPKARQKMKSIGIAPAPNHAGLIELALLEAVTCPHCGSQQTLQKNSFGPALCRSIYFCKSCNQPFERFKPV